MPGTRLIPNRDPSPCTSSACAALKPLGTTTPIPTGQRKEQKGVVVRLGRPAAPRDHAPGLGRNCQSHVTIPLR